MSADLPAASPDTTEALIQRCLRGDQAAWESIVKQYCLKVFNSLDTFDRRANFQTWLISVSRNLCIDHYRSVRKERETIDRNVDADALSPVSHEEGPAAALEQQDRVRLLREAMAALPEA